jgi:ABC-2 type transport system ATP-binding protein
MQALMATVADGRLTVLLSSHNVGELERVCDYLVVIAGGRVQLAGDIEDLLEEHRLLVGPGVDVSAGGGVIHVDRSDRHTHVVARTGPSAPMPGWQSHPIGLEELVLAYLRQAHHGAMVDPGLSA